jgi:hypothetical protein
MIISIHATKKTLAVITYDGIKNLANCVRTFQFSHWELTNLWDELFGYVADRSRQGKVEKLVLLQDSADLCGTERTFGMLVGIASEFKLPIVRVQWVDEYAEADAWKALPDRAGETEVALALAAAFVSMDGARAVVA